MISYSLQGLYYDFLNGGYRVISVKENCAIGEWQIIATNDNLEWVYYLSPNE